MKMTILHPLDKCPDCGKESGYKTIPHSVHLVRCWECRMAHECCQGDEDCDYREAAIKAERSAIVKWLRDRCSSKPAGIDSEYGIIVKEATGYIADAIEAGEHLK